MDIVFDAGEWPEAVITASLVEFAAMAGRIAELARAGAGEVVFPAGPAPPADSAGRVLSALVVRVGSGPLLLAVQPDGVLVACGGPEAVELFGRNMPAEPSLPAGYHVHFEHAGREWHVAAESVPLVLMVGRARGA
jgi:hypothetical protein